MDGTQQENMILSDSTSPILQTHDADEFGRYSSVSVLAILALVLGIASALTLLVPLLVVLPVVAIVLALFALLRIHASEGSLSGTGLAHAAIFLSALFLVAGPMRFYVRDTMYEQQSVETTQKWFQFLAEEKFPEAVGMMTGNAVQSLMPSQPPGTPRKPPEIGDIVSMLKTSPVYSKVAPILKQGKLEHTAVGLGRRGSLPIAAIVFDLPGDPPQKLHVNLLRLQARVASPTWQIDGWNLAD